MIALTKDKSVMIGLPNRKRKKGDEITIDNGGSWLLVLVHNSVSIRTQTNTYYIPGIPTYNTYILGVLI